MRVRLRVPSFADAAHAARCMQDPEAMRWVASIPAPYLPQAVIDFATRSALAKDYSILADGEFAGLIRTGADLGYWVARRNFGDAGWRALPCNWRCSGIFRTPMSHRAPGISSATNRRERCWSRLAIRMSARR